MPMRLRFSTSLGDGPHSTIPGAYLDCEPAVPLSDTFRLIAPCGFSPRDLRHRFRTVDKLPCWTGRYPQFAQSRSLVLSEHSQRAWLHNLASKSRRSPTE